MTHTVTINGEPREVEVDWEWQRYPGYHSTGCVVIRDITLDGESVQLTYDQVCEIEARIIQGEEE